MRGEDLDAPLGVDRDDDRPRRDIPWKVVAIAGIGLLAAGLVIFSRITDDGAGGEPYAVATIVPAPSKPAQPPPHAEVAPPAAVATQTAAAAGITRVDGQVDTENGVRVVRNGASGTPGALIIEVPSPLGLHLAPAPDRRLVERTAAGLIPRIGADGTRPLDVYARPAVPSPTLKAGAPRIALVVGGMGLSQLATDHAIEALPGAVTLAFAPYGSDVAPLAAKAREAGHELLLQVPMEPFDTSQSPGAHMLQVDLSPEQNREHLHWAMARFPGYVGVMNFLGAKFTAQEATLLPMMRDAAGRGLLWLDDGTSARSLAPGLAASAGLPVLQAQISLDGPREGLEAALGKLETQARDHGMAIGVASGLPATVDRLGEFARGLEKRGIALVPISALAGDAARTTAQTTP